MKKYVLNILAVTVIGLGACRKDYWTRYPLQIFWFPRAFETKSGLPAQANRHVLRDEALRSSWEKYAIASEEAGKISWMTKANNVTLNATWRMVPTGEAQGSERDLVAGLHYH